MNDNLSLEVAKIMWPEYAWEQHDGRTLRWVGNIEGNPEPIFFDYTTDAALGQMAVWVAKQTVYVKGDQAADTQLKMIYRRLLVRALASDNPNLALAEAIMEIVK